MYVFSSFSNKKKNLSNKYIYPLLFQKKNKLSKAIPSQIGGSSIKSNNLNNSIDSNEILEIFTTYSRNKPKPTVIIEPIKKISFTYIVQYAREKIKKEFVSPYVERLITNKNFKYIREEDMPIYICLYKINDIFLKKKNRLTTNFYESNIYYSENEYLIKSFKKVEFLIIMRYLLAFIYDKDFYCHYSKYEYRHKNKVVKEKFTNLINNNYIFNQSEEQEISNSERNKNNNSKEDYFNKLYQKNISKHIIKKKSLIFLSEYENLEEGKIRENYFLRNPKYFFIKDLPKSKIPNAVPNYLSLGNFIISLLKKFEIKNKFKIYEIKNSEIIERKPNIDNIIEESFEQQKKKKKLEDVEDEEDSSDSSESHSKDVLNEIYLESSSNNSNLSINFISRKITRRYSTILGNNYNIAKKKKNEDNDIIDVEKLIKKIELKKENIIIEKRPSTSSNLLKKKTHKKTTIKSQFQGFQIINMDNFKLYNEYDVNSNIIQRTFSRKISNKFLLKQKENIPQLILPNMNNNSLSINNSISKNQNILKNNKYFLTSTSLNKYPYKTKHSLSNIVRMKKTYKSSKNNLQKYYLNKEDQKIVHFSNNRNTKHKSNYFNSKYYNPKNIIYPDNFKNKGKILKQRKISFSIIHNSHKIEFKDTKEFISGIKKSFKNKKYQKELIKEIISNFGVVHQKRNKSNKFRKFRINTNKNHLYLSNNEMNTKTSNNKKYRENVSEFSIKTSQLSTQKEVLRDSINLNGIFKHKKINL